MYSPTMYSNPASSLIMIPDLQCTSPKNYDKFSPSPSVKTLQGLGMLDVSMVTVGARAQWFNGSVVQRRV